jgi:hypothetical protein
MSNTAFSEGKPVSVNNIVSEGKSTRNAGHFGWIHF